MDTIPKDTFLSKITTNGPQTLDGIDWTKVRLSPDSLSEPVDTRARDSMFMDVQNKKLHLWGEAHVEYETYVLDADYIIFDWANNLVEAMGNTDTLGKTINRPQFKDKDQNFTASRIKFNFKTKKGLIYDAASQFEELFIVGKTTKFISSGTDTTETQIIYNENAIFSTCSHPEPHFGIRSKKQKVIPERLVVVGPSNLEIEGIPTPLWLPFGFYPITQGKRSGLIFPEFKTDNRFGMGLENGGWYFPLGEKMDLSLTGSLYFNGTWKLNGFSNYKKRYKYNGSFGMNFNNIVAENLETGQNKSTKALGIRWTHNQDSKAHPYRTFGGSVNLQTGQRDRVVNNTASSVLNNQINSNISYTQRFPGNTSQLAVSFNHSQNQQTRQFSVNFPTVTFNTGTVNPFKGKSPIGKEGWYEKINISYAGQALNRINATDTTIFTPAALDSAQYGMKHSFNTSYNGRFLKYFSFNVGGRLDESWYFKTIERINDGIAVFDTTKIVSELDSQDTLLQITKLRDGTVRTLDNNGFKALHLFNTNAGVNTQVFGTLLFKRGFVRGIRHVMKPGVSLNYTPDYKRASLGYFRTVTNNQGNEVQYSIFDNGILDRPGATGQQLNVAYSIGNIIEAKVRGKRDTLDRRIQLIRNLNITGAYNLAAEKNPWSLVNMTGNTTIFKGLTQVTFGAAWDPYAEGVDGLATEQLHYDATGKLLRFTAARLNFATNFTIDEVRKAFSRIVSGEQPPALNNRESEEENPFGMFGDFRINHNLNFIWERELGTDTIFARVNSLSTSGSINLTEGWRLNIGQIGYDFAVKRVTYPDFGLSRDLHCWEMGFNWQPQRGTVAFYLRVKPGPLGFLEVPWRGTSFQGF